MTSFAFEVVDVFDLGDGYKGVTLAGPPFDTTGGLGVGDTLSVPIRGGGRKACECVEFPLVNLGPERTTWVRVSVLGVLPDDVEVGRRATRQL